MNETFAHTSPYGGCWLEHFYRKGCTDLYRRKVKTESHLRTLARDLRALPDLMILGNFIVERQGIQSYCREVGVDWVASEDGFFPHYETIHADPLGFSWESSIPRMIYRSLSDRHRIVAARARTEWTSFNYKDLPDTVKKPFVLWPLQLTNDKVNRFDLNVNDWSNLLAHFRSSLPPEVQIVVKAHPRGGANQLESALLSMLPNTVLLNASCDLKSLIRESSAVAGANSSVLLEARLMFMKPVYAYARGWYTNHTQLVLPISASVPPRMLNRLDYVEKNSILTGDPYLSDYADWFLAQLLMRQISRKEAKNWEGLRTWTSRRTYKAFVKYGEDLFM